jgi:hypothetical protein
MSFKCHERNFYSVTRRKRLRFMFGPPEGRPTKTQLHEAVVYPRVLHLAFSIWKVHNNPEAAIPACANKLDIMEPYGRIPMLTHASRGTGAPAICKIAKRPRQGKQKLSPRNPPLRKELRGSNCHPVKIGTCYAADTACFGYCKPNPAWIMREL